MSGPALEFEVAFEAPVAQVFGALTRARELERWFCDECESEPCANGRLMMRWNRPGSSSEPFRALWVEFVPGERAAFRGGHAGYPGGDAGTVRYALAPSGAGTRLAVCHTLPAREGYEGMLALWQAAWPRALARLAEHLAARV